MKRVLVVLLSLLFSNSYAQWNITELAEMPEGITNNGVSEGFHNGETYVYAFGALDYTKTKEGIHQRCYRYNFDQNSWQQIANLPDTSGKLASWATRIQDTIYIAGGYHVKLTNGNEYSSNKLHRFNVSTQSFMNDAENIPTNIDDQVQALWRDSLLFIVTGWSGAGFSGSNTNIVQIYNPYTNSWQTGTSTPNTNDYKSFGASGTIVGDTIYYFGGATSGMGFGPQYNLRKGVINPDNPMDISWSIETTSYTAYRAACVSFNDDVLWIGGSENTYNYDGIAYDGSGGVDPASRILSYNTKNGIWTQIPIDVPMDLRGIAKIGEGRFIICGGMDSSQVVSNKTLLIEHQSVVNSLNIKENTVKIFPNPVQKELKLQGVDYNVPLKIFNVNGELVISMLSEPTINVSELPSGTYVLKIGDIEKQFTKQ